MTSKTKTMKTHTKLDKMTIGCLNNDDVFDHFYACECSLMNPKKRKSANRHSSGIEALLFSLLFQ